MTTYLPLVAVVIIVLLLLWGVCLIIKLLLRLLQVKRYILEQEGKSPFDYDVYNCPSDLKGQLKIGDFSNA